MRLRRRTVSAWSPKPSLMSPSLLPPPEMLAGRKAVERRPGSDGYDGTRDGGCEGDELLEIISENAVVRCDSGLCIALANR